MKKLIASAIGFLFIFNSCSKDDSGKIKVYEKDAKIAGYTMPNLSEEFNKWVFSQPIETNPLNDPDGGFHQNQPLNNFIFLSPNIGGVQNRTLTFSHNKNVFIPVMGVSVWYYDNDPCDPDFKPAAGQTPKQFLQEAAAGFLETSSDLVLTLNGNNIVDDITQCKSTTEAFKASVHNDWNNPDCDYSKLKATMYAEDYAVCIKLPKGNHVLRVKGEYKADNFLQDITWNLKVE